MEKICFSARGLYVASIYLFTALALVDVVTSLHRPSTKIIGEKPDHIIRGQNVTIQCNITMDHDIDFDLHWKIPDGRKIENGHVQIHDTVYENNDNPQYRDGIRLLNIQNVTTEDKGQYICIVTDRNDFTVTNNFTYILKVFEHDDTFLNLTAQGGVFELLSQAGTDKIQWIIYVSAYPTPQLVWRDPNGKKIKVNMNPDKEKMYVENNADDYKMRSKLVIKDLRLNNSGRYELFADNGALNQTIYVTLLVKDKPSAIITNRSKLKQFYKVGILHSVECRVEGYPLPKVEWAFKKCPNYPECERSFIQIPSSMHKETAIKEVVLLSVLNITATETGMLLCNVSNEVGSSNTSHIFLVTDLNVYNDSAEYRSPLIVEGDNKTFECGASIYEYQDNMQWIHRNLNGVENNITTDKKFLITHNITSYSYNLNLTIKNITKKDDGEYVCKADKSNTQNSVYTLYQVVVNTTDQRVPVFTTKSRNLDVKTGQPVELECYVHGMPPPTISWIKNERLLNLAYNDTRVLLLDTNQKLFIRHTALEDEGSYTCEASNRIGSVALYFTLDINDKPKVGTHFVYIVSVLSILLGVLIICYSISLEREKKLKRDLAQAGLLYFDNGNFESWNPDLGIEEQTDLIPYDKRLEFPRHKLKLGNQIGSGQFGVVFKADARDIVEKDTITTVAVKMVKPNRDSSYIKALASELKILTYVGKHLNVVNLLGAYTGNKRNRELMIIVEYCRFGNLHDYLLKQRDYFVNQVTPNGSLDYEIKTISKNTFNNVLKKSADSEKSNESGTRIGSDGNSVADVFEPEWRSNYCGDYTDMTVKTSCTHDLIFWSYQVARGMEYLASRKILHGDLATRNILLTEELVVKISDFGLAKTMFNNDNYRKKSKGVLPIRWMAIESIGDRVFSTQSDVWTFGVVLWEIFSLAVTPYPDVQIINGLYSKLVEGYRMEQPKYANLEIYNIMLDCWKMKPTLRPSFTDLAERLGPLLQEDTKSHYMNSNDSYLRMNGSRTPDYSSFSSVSTILYNLNVMNSNALPKFSESSERLELGPISQNNSG